MKRILTALVFGAMTVFAASAWAHGDGKADHAKFPMTATEFKAKSEARIAKGKARLEERIKERQVPDAKAKEMRAKFDEVTGKVRVVVAKVTADGTVTKEEAKEVRQTVRAARGGGRHRHEKK